MDSYILESLIFIPVLTAFVLILIPSSWIRVIRGISVAVGALLMWFSGYVFFAFEENGSASNFQFIKEYEWLETVGISFSLGVDGLAALMVLLTGIVSITGLVIATNVAKEPKNYYILLFTLIAGVYGTFVSIDLFFFFFFYELAIVPMYLLIAVWGSSSKFKDFARTKEYSALKLVLMIVAASVLVWIGVITIYVQAGAATFNILELSALIQSDKNPLSSDFQNIVFPMMMIGFGLLAGLWPFHTWSPDGHVAAPTSVSMLHAGVLMKLGAFGIIRVGMSLLPEGFETWSLLLLILGTINVVYGAISALSQTDLKYVIGYSSVSHMGYVLMGIGTADTVGLAGASLQMFSHGVMTALFFAMVGAIYERTHTRDTLVLNGLASRMGWASGFFILAGLASLGLPGLSGFVSELLVFIGAFRTEPLLGILGIIGAAITATYILRLIGRVFFGRIDSQWEVLTDLSIKEFSVGAFLIIPIVGVGIFPAPFLNVIRPSVDVIMRGIS